MLTERSLTKEKSDRGYKVDEKYWFGSEDTYPDQPEEKYNKVIPAQIINNKISCKPVTGRFVIVELNTSNSTRKIRGILANEPLLITDDGGRKTEHWIFFEEQK